MNKILTSTEENFPRDTLDPLCGPLVEAILYLGKKLKLHRHICTTSSLPPCETDLTAVVSQDPPKGWHFLSLEAGEAEALSGLKKCVVGQRKCTVIKCNSAEFVRSLLGAMVSLRHHLPIVGLLPMDQIAFLELVHSWNTNLTSAEFEWRWDVKNVSRVLRRRLAENYAYAAFGFLVRLPSKCRDRLRFSDKFPVDTLTLRPGVDVSPAELDGIEGAIVTYSPIPQTPVSEHFVYYKGNCPELESTIRKHLKQTPSSARLEYCVRPSNEQRRAMTAPIEVLNKAGLEVDRPLGQAAYGSAAIILVPMHFAIHPPKVSLDQLVNFGGEMSKIKAVTNVFEENGEKLLTFYFQPILYAIIMAFRKNAYGDRLAFLGLMQKQLLRKWKGAELSGEFLAGGKRRFEPQYYFAEEELVGTSLSKLTKSRLSHCKIRRRALGANGIVQDRATHRYPGYSVSHALRKTLVGLDADFLLREVSEHHWTSLAAAANEWESLYRESYSEWISESNKHPEILRNLLAAQCRDAWKGKEDELSDLALDTVDLSTKQTSRLLRNAVENAQRLLLSGREPLTIVVRKRSELINL